MPNYATYHIGQKILLRKGNKFLFLKIPEYNILDLPGGRIDDNEETKDLKEILDREVKEELGKDLIYKLGNILFQYRRYTPNGTKVFLTIFDAEYLSGEIKLSLEHEKYEWINPKESGIKRDDFFNEEEYKAFLNYFNKL
jgi:8-oxo-dGTP pyrophosphatase MutT (NUDIX family)